MLAPDQRELFLDALRPPEGYRFDRGIGTTFTLDLLTLLIAPLSLAFLEVSDSATALSDPVLLLEGLRRHTDRLTIFCQAGRIAVPPPHNYLYSLLEKSVVEVQALRGGVFHPKVWLLRYVAQEGEESPVYRFLNLSRNLTFDKFWDLMLRLEGRLATHRRHAYGRNHPLGDFVRRLLDLALRPVDQHIVDTVELLQHEVRRVAFKLPSPFSEDDLVFYPFGVPGYPGYRFDGGHHRAMVVSPFLNDELLRQVAEPGARHVLVSRADSIAALEPETLARFEKIYVLDESGTAEVEPEEDPTEGVGAEVAAARPEPSGLHAKLFILEEVWDATWLMGSANATNAAFKRKNVEFMVGLNGRKSKVGIDKVLGEEGDENAILSLLQVYRPGGEVEVNEEQKQAETLVNRVRDWLIALEMQLEVMQQEEDHFDLLLHRKSTNSKVPRGNYEITCWPVTLRPERKVTFESTTSSVSLSFMNLSTLALTPFIAFKVTAQVGRHRHILRFVLNMPISGVPRDRKDHLFSAIISDRARFLRYLLMMLAGEKDGPPHWADWIGEEAGRSWRTTSGDMEMPLLEALVRALSRSPEKIDRISELVEGLRRTPKGREVLPEGFEPFWEAVIQARSEIQ